MEKLLSILNSFNLGDMIAQVLNYVAANPFQIWAAVTTTLFIFFMALYTDKVVMYRHAKQQAKDATQRANQAELMRQVTEKSWENADADYKKTAQDFVDELKLAKDEYADNYKVTMAEYTSEMEKREHVYNGQMKQLRDEIKCLKDEHRREAITKAIEYQRATHIPQMDLIEMAQKIYRFYGGKV